MKRAPLRHNLEKMKSQRAVADLSRKVQFLRQSSAYGEGAMHVAVIETHFSWVFLTPSRAYKLKKPVRQASMDYRSLKGRERGCRTEVRLNRRLAPDVYLGVVPLGRRADGQLVLGRAPTVVDWLVAMRRLPSNRMLDAVMLRGALGAAELRGVVQLLADFYAGARRRPSTAARYLQGLHDRTLSHARELARPRYQLPLKRVQALAAAQLQFMQRCRSELGRRAALLVEGHGDLRPEHVFLGAAGQAPAVIDCLEFDAALRRLDPMEEVASRAMECASAGAAAVAQALLRKMRAALRDGASDALLYFYMSQRATTRAQMAAWHVRDPKLARRFAHWRARAAHYLAQAEQWAGRALHESPPGAHSSADTGQRSSSGATGRPDSSRHNA